MQWLLKYLFCNVRLHDMCKGSLCDYLFGHIVSTLLTFSQRVSIALDIAMGVNVGNIYVHRDLKCVNLLLDENLRAVVTDLGLV